MEEQLISFETAKLAKEKGFNERGHYFYKVKSENDIELYGCTKKQLVTVKSYVRIYHKIRDYHTNKEKLNAKLYRCSAPTQSLLAKWLREKHNIHTWVTPYTKEGRFNINPLSVPDGYRCDIYPFTKSMVYDTYEEALEIGLQEGLKLI